MTMKSARVMCESMVAVSDTARSSEANSLRVSLARIPSFGVLRFGRERYGAMRMVVVPSLTPQPAVPRYFSVTPADAAGSERNASASSANAFRFVIWIVYNLKSHPGGHQMRGAAADAQAVRPAAEIAFIDLFRRQVFERAKSDFVKQTREAGGIEVQPERLARPCDPRSQRIACDPQFGAQRGCFERVIEADSASRGQCGDDAQGISG